VAGRLSRGTLGLGALLPSRSSPPHRRTAALVTNTPPREDGNWGESKGRDGSEARRGGDPWLWGLRAAWPPKGLKGTRGLIHGS
jgi:hypothetical protein